MARTFWSLVVVTLVAAALAAAQTSSVLPALILENTTLINAHYAIGTLAAGAQINWLTGQLESVGIGYGTGSDEAAKIQARATAIMVMVHEARRLMPQLPFDADFTAGDAVAKAGSTVNMETIFTGIATVDERWERDTRRYVMVGVIPLYGRNGVTKLAFSTLLPETPATPSMSDLTMLRPIPRGHTPQRFGDPYTGIIIDGDALLLQPCLCPRLLRFDGVELWGPGTVLPDMPNSIPKPLLAGPVRYLRNVDEAVASGLAGDRPLILQAVGAAYGRYPVLNLDDSYMITLYDQQSGLLSRLPMLITLGQTAEQPIPATWPAVYASTETAGWEN
jgi:hypothetical protein